MENRITFTTSNWRYNVPFIPYKSGLFVVGRATEESRVAPTTGTNNFQNWVYFGWGRGKFLKLCGIDAKKHRKKIRTNLMRFDMDFTDFYADMLCTPALEKLVSTHEKIGTRGAGVKAPIIVCCAKLSSLPAESKSSFESPLRMWKWTEKNFSHHCLENFKQRQRIFLYLNLPNFLDQARIRAWLGWRRIP